MTLTVSDGEKTDTASQRIVVGSTPPVAEIDDSLPLNYDTITFRANEYSDDGETLPPTAYKWTVVFHHAQQAHPFRDNIIGTKGSITIPRTRDQLGDTFYRVTLTVTDSSGLSSTTSRDIRPNLVTLTFNASDPQAAFTVDVSATRARTPSPTLWSASSESSERRHLRHSQTASWCSRVGRTAARRPTSSPHQRPTPHTR